MKMETPPLLLLLLLLCSSSGTWDLVLVHTNDVHAHVEESNRYFGKCSGSECYGGVARRATALKKIRSSEENVLLLDAGDQFTGTIWFNHYKGTEAARFMNAMSYDAMAIGNHEFDNGVEGLKPFLKQTQFPVLSANIRTDQTLAATFGTMYRPYTILTVGGQKVGVVGYTSQDTPSLSNTGSHLTFEEEVAALQVNVDKLLTLGVNKIIALGHSGFIKDQEIAQKVQGVDVVVGGHSHTFLYTGTPPSFEKPIGSYPVMVQSDDGRQVPVVQAYRFGKYLGYLKVTFDEAGNVLTSTGNPILLDNSIPQDPDIFAEVNQLKENLAKYTLQVIGKTYVLLNGLMENCRFKECNLGNLICDAVVDYYVRYSGGDHWNIVSACIMNAGGIRASIEERSRNGTITFDDLSAVLPFRGSFDLVQLKGSTLRKAFEHSVKKYGLGTGEFLQVSGIQVEFDMTRPPGSRVRSLSILCTKCRVPRYEAVEDGSVYMVLMTSYMVDGGDGYDMIQEEMLKHTSGDLDISIVSAFISQRKGVYPSLDGRIKIHNSASGLQGRMALLVLTALWTLV